MSERPISPNQTISAFQTASTKKIHQSAGVRSDALSTYPVPACADEYMKGSLITVSADQVDCLKCRKAMGLD